MQLIAGEILVDVQWFDYVGILHLVRVKLVGVVGHDDLALADEVHV